jgi:DnaJ-class molecular chaperone
MAKSYYAILGVTSCATPDEIRSAYRRLAKEYHPDRFEGGSGPFRQIQEAYSVLGNAERRRQYEASLPKPSFKSCVRPGYCVEPEPLIAEKETFDIDQAQSGSYGRFPQSPFAGSFERLWYDFPHPCRHGQKRLRNYSIDIPLTRQQTVHGGTARVMAPARAVCPSCRGYGDTGFFECTRCSGAGIITGEMPVSIEFPPGLTQNLAVSIPLERFGFPNVHLIVRFVPTERDTL